MPNDHDNLSRRSLFQAAGGISLLALVPRLGRTAEEPTTYHAEFAESNQAFKDNRPPVFIALPYLQPGANASKLVEGNESVILAWQTDGIPAEFKVSYGLHGDEHTVEPTTKMRISGSKSESDTRLNYAAELTRLKLGTRYRYKVSMEGQTVLEGYFSTRKPRGHKARFVSFGDNSYGEISDRNIAYQAYHAMPDFVMNTGDNVYESGLDNEYARYFFPVYNSDQAGPRLGGPLLRSVPFFTVLANHDVSGKHPGGGPGADFTKYADALGYFTNMYLPLNGPVSPTPTPIFGSEPHIKIFTEAAGDRFPRMGNYSFDYGDGHFLCLDSNVYIDPTSRELQSWIEQDLQGTDAAWKIVVYHHPAFNVGLEHYDEQHMRVLCGLFEKSGVALVLSGHEHTYQRTRPLKFTPKDSGEGADVNSKTRLVPGVFQIDRQYDGVSNKRPDGILYITTGAGGKHLYDAELNQNPKNWLHEEDNYADYVAKVITDRHSLTVIDMDSRSLVMRQVDQWGNEIDRWDILKG
jgi:hypothetical protein